MIGRKSRRSIWGGKRARKVGYFVPSCCAQLCGCVRKP